MEIDSENLFALVFERKALWDKTAKEYRNRILVDRLWRQVSTELGGVATTDDVKKKWKNLRNSFGKELKKIPEGRSGDAGPLNCETYTTWPFLTQMMFLKDQMRSRKSGGNLGSVSTAQEEDLDDSADLHQTVRTVASDDHNDVSNRDVFEIDSVAEVVANSRARFPCVKRGAQQQLIEIETRKLRLLEQKANKLDTKEDDEDVAFFKSLIPHVRKIKAEQKLRFRTDIQNVVLQYVYNEHRMQTMSDTRSVQSFTPSQNRIHT
ncbi:uncharacterized protein LOC110678812 [Aedes aegypti]|uniref:MADF domain-containing protein n=1 Tax=Aedes aegypti TaxID=7159 RepID=A0A6I8U4R3_AEDAE|nr:uncharacterized protein LOC110678812 [Aedes aegypti]